MKRILIFAPTAPGSGITQYILNLLNHADLSEFQFDILSFHNLRLEKWATEHGGRYFDLTVSLYKHPIQYRNYLKSVFSGGYDAVHYHLSSISTLRIFKFAKQCGVPKMILQSHNSGSDVASSLRRRVFENLHKLLRKSALKYFDVISACSKAAADWMFGEKAAGQAVIFNNAIELERFAFRETDRDSVRAEYGLEGKTVIGHIGRFSAQKNHRFLVDTFSALCQKRENCALMLVGEGELRRETEQYVKELHLEHSVRFIDFQEDIERYYSAMDLFVLPSLFEGFPIVLMEAQANGLCCAISDQITKETNITGRIEYIPLEAGSAAWADRIAARISDCQRVQTADILAERGYSLAEQARKVFDFYQ